jgi:PKD repeat protein
MSSFKKFLFSLWLVFFICLSIQAEKITELYSDDLYIQDGEYRIHRDMISFQTTDLDTARAAAEEYGLQIDFLLTALSKETGRCCGYYMRKADTRTPIKDIILSMTSRRGILFAGPTYQIKLMVTPNDTDFSKLYGMHNTGQTGGTSDADIDAPEAWDKTTGSTDLIVAIIDTGINYNHEDLAANMWKNPGETAGNNKDDDGNGYVDDIYGFNSITNTGNPLDDNNHGSHCAGSIGGVGNNSKGVAGVCWKVKLMGLKFLDSSGSGDTSDAVQCMDYALDQLNKGQKIVVTSNSWGGGGFDQNMFDAIEAAGAKGCLFSAAAGNSSANNDTTATYPGNYNSNYVISVAATDHNDALASFSNYGAKTVDLAAPGVNIYSCSKSTGYMQMSGTSMACPHVSGACALIKAALPSATPLEIKQLILDNVDTKSSLSGKCLTGGRLNVNKAISSAPAINADFTYVIKPFPNQRTVDFTDTSSSSATINKWSWTFGDGGTSTLQNPSRTYSANGSYSVKLTVTDSSGKTDSETKTVVIADPAPIDAQFSYTINDLQVAFNDDSITQGTVQSWTWDFGDGVSSTAENPTHTYSNYGIYSVKLTVKDNIPSTDSITKAVELKDEPPAPCASAGEDYSMIWINKVELGTLNNSSNAAGYTDFTKTVTAPELKRGSSYNLNITISTAQYTNWFKAYIDYNRDGDFADSGEVIYVIPQAQKVISAGGAITIPANAVKGTARLRIQVKNITTNNLPAPEPCETFAYGEVEDYYVKITEDCSTPVANFTYSIDQCTANFTNTSSSADPIVAYSWAFGNGSSSTLANPSCTYGANGNYSVKLTVTNSCGKSAFVTKTVSITNCNPDCSYDHLVGSFPDIGIWLRDSQTAVWTQLSKQQADIIRVGDVNGNGKDDMAALFKNTGKLWYRYDNSIWEDIPASAATLVAFDLGDMNNDGREDLVGSWSDKGLWWRNNTNGVWTKLSNMVPTLVAAGDFDGDKKADVVGLFPSLNSIWIYFSSNTWKQISKQINLTELRAGNMDNDVKAELVGSWDIGVWMFDPETNVWVQHHKKQAKQIAVGDINAGCLQDIVGYWDAATPLYVKYMENNLWEKLSNYNPDTLDAGKVK